MTKKSKKVGDLDELTSTEPLPDGAAPLYKPIKGFGVKKADLVQETPMVKTWRKGMLKTYSGLEQFGNLGIQNPDMMLKLLNEIGYDMDKLDVGDGRKAKSYQTGSPYGKILTLIREQRPHIHTHTSSSTIIETDDTIYMYGCGGYNYKELHLRKKLKAEILENIVTKQIQVPDLTNEDSNYMVYSDFIKNADLEQSAVDVDEFDITKAYYACAHYLGYMGDEMYHQCISLPKKIRLRFIGSIATFKRHYLRSGFDITGYSAETNPILRKVWFHIVKHVDDCMQEFLQLAGDNFIMYYVDGIYVKKYKQPDVKNPDAPLERIDYTPILDYIKQKYGFTFSQGEIYGITPCYISTGRSKHSGLKIFKKNDHERKEFTGYWMPKQFSIKGGGNRELDIVPQWQLLIDAFQQAGNAKDAAKLLADNKDFEI